MVLQRSALPLKNGIIDEESNMKVMSVCFLSSHLGTGSPGHILLSQ